MKKIDIFFFIIIFIFSWVVFSSIKLFSNIFICWGFGSMPLLIFVFYSIFITLKRREKLLGIGFTLNNWLKAIAWGIGTSCVIIFLVKYFLDQQYLGYFNNLGIGIIYWCFLSFTQEIFFRGYLQGNLEKQYGSFLGIIITSFLFAFWHLTIGFSPVWLQPFSLLKVFLVSLLWGLSFQKTKSLVAPCLSHFLVGVFLSNFNF